MKLFELYFSDLTPAAQKEWVDTFGEKPIEFIPIHSFELCDDDENSMKVDGIEAAPGKEFLLWF